MTHRTFTIIKPNAVGAGNAGKILAHIEQGGFRIIALKMVFLSRSDAEKFYHVHKGKYFFRKLCTFMTSGAIVTAVLEKDNAVAEFRRFIGATNPAEAAEGSIRRLYGDSKTRNAIHASDSDDNAAWEVSFFFTDREMIEADYFIPVPLEEIDKD